MVNDAQLLKCYAARAGGHEDAFAEVVRRYLNLVYSAAFRLVGHDSHSAKDVTQLVFANLAHRAGRLPPETVLAGWLHRDTCFTALEFLRGERRRKIREEKAMKESDSAEAAIDWDQISPVLDQALNELPAADRHAILLRFFEGRPLKEVGEHLGLGESGASRRLSSALEKLRAALARSGVTTTASALALVASTQTIQAAPPGLAAVVLKGSLMAAATPSTTSFLFKSLLIAMKTKITVTITAAAVLLSLLGTVAVYHYHLRRTAADATWNQLMAEQRQHIQPMMPILRTLLIHAIDHGGVFPDSLAQAGVSDDRFEWLGRGVLANSPEATPILREKASWPTLNGRRGRVYGYSDGHAQTLISGDPAMRIER